MKGLGCHKEAESRCLLAFIYNCLSNILSCDYWRLPMEHKKITCAASFYNWRAEWSELHAVISRASIQARPLDAKTNWTGAPIRTMAVRSVVGEESSNWCRFVAKAMGVRETAWSCTDYSWTLLTMYVNQHGCYPCRRQLGLSRRRYHDTGGCWQLTRYNQSCVLNTRLLVW